MSLTKPAQGVLFCGSITLPDSLLEGLDESQATEMVMRETNRALPLRLRRLPDGELGKRNMFVVWQAAVFLATPGICKGFCLQHVGLTEETAKLSPDEKIILGKPGYAEYAIRNYQIFARLKKEGVIESSTRFQVCIPTPLNPVTVMVRPSCGLKVEPLYEALIIEELREIQNQIPHQELAIQFDCPIELAILEGEPGPGGVWESYCPADIGQLVDRMVKVAAEVKPDVELGIHLCYGDYMHQHFREPKDTAIMVSLANAYAAALTTHHPINYIHMPVPINRTDDAYFAPLKDLSLHEGTEMYLGLVHANDLEGTKVRIETAKKVVPAFGIATECGLGRTPQEDVISIVEILSKISSELPPPKGISANGHV